MEMQIEYKQKMASQLKEWSAQINLLVPKVVNAESEVKLNRARKLYELRVKQRAAFEQINELGRTGGEAWERVKETADKIWEELKIGVPDAQAKFK